MENFTGLVFGVGESDILESKDSFEIFWNHWILRVLDKRLPVDKFKNSGGSHSALGDLLDSWGKLSQVKSSHQDAEEDDQHMSCGVDLSTVNTGGAAASALDALRTVPEAESIRGQDRKEESPYADS